MMKGHTDRALLLARRLLEADGEGEPIYDWREWFTGDDYELIDYLSTLTTIYLDGKPYFNDSNEAILIPRREGDPAYRFDTYDAYREFLRAHNADTEGVDDVDVSRHVYNIKSPTVPEISLEDKLKHEVYRTKDGQWIFLKMPTDENFIQREGVDMRHCLSVAHKDYCARMRTAEIDLYSMIDATKGKPVVDIEIALTKSSYGGPVGQPTVTQLRGEANECPPQDKYLPALAEFFSTFGKNWKLTGVRSFDGRYDGEEFLKRWHALGNPRLGESTAKNVVRQESIWSKLFGEPVSVPDGTIIRSNTDDRFDVEYAHDPNLNRWWYSTQLKAHILPLAYDETKKLYRCRVLYRGIEGRMKEDELMLPYSNAWEPSQKPVTESTAKDFILGNPSPFEIRPISDGIWQVLKEQELVGTIYFEKLENIPVDAHANWRDFPYTAIKSPNLGVNSIEFFRTLEEAYQYLTGQA